MQASASEASPVTGTVNRVPPTREQEEYARGFEVALDRIYAQRGTPVAVRIRSPSTQPTSDPAAPSNCASVRSAERPGGQSPSGSSSGGAAAVSVSRSTPAVVMDLMVSADHQEAAPATTAIPLCVARLTENDSLDQHQLSDEEQQPSNSRQSTGMNKLQ